MRDLFLSGDSAHSIWKHLGLIRALMDTKRQFWEESFQHCLQFERKHVYQAFMTREGRWHNQHEADAPTRRIPRKHIESLDQPVLHANGEMWELDIENGNWTTID